MLALRPGAWGHRRASLLFFLFGSHMTSRVAHRHCGLRSEAAFGITIRYYESRWTFLSMSEKPTKRMFKSHIHVGMGIGWERGSPLEQRGPITNLLYLLRYFSKIPRVRREKIEKSTKNIKANGHAAFLTGRWVRSDRSDFPHGALSRRGTNSSLLRSPGQLPAE